MMSGNVILFVFSLFLTIKEHYSQIQTAVMHLDRLRVIVPEHGMYL